MKNESILFNAQGRALQVLVLVFDETNALSLASVVDPFRAANRRAGKRLFEWVFATPTGTASTLTAGIQIQGISLSEAASTDLLICVGSFNIQRQITPRLITAIRWHAHRAIGIAAVDAGAWVLAGAGLLNGYAATPHWEDHDAFATAFPEVKTKRSRFEIDRNRLTTAGAAPCLDMMLELIARRHGASLSARVASAFIYDPITDGTAPQATVPTAALARKAPLVASAISLMNSCLDDPMSIAEISTALNISPRTLELRFQKTLETSPKAYFQNLRLSEAHRLASDTNQPVQEIALATGFMSQASFARAFKATYGQSVRDLRKSRP
jgi:transcriptional regulator GlxA family with amidase domain